jgi:hypothetical protein
MIGYYAGVKGLLGIQQDSTRTGASPTETETPQPDIETPQQTETPPPETETPTQNVIFSSDFQSGEFSNQWSIMWYEGNATPGDESIRPNSNNWSVRENPQTGSLALNLRGEGNSNAVATDERIIDFTEDMRFSYSFMPDSNGIGARVTALDFSRNGTAEDRIVEETPRARFGAAERGNEFHFLDHQRTFDRELFAPNEMHNIEVEWIDDVLRGYHNGELIMNTNDVSFDDVAISRDGTYRLQVQANGGYGGSVDFWIDNVSLEYL